MHKKYPPSEVALNFYPQTQTRQNLNAHRNDKQHWKPRRWNSQ